MRLVVDANILIAELIRVRGRKLISNPKLELYMAEKVWEETIYELNKRVEIFKKKYFLKPSLAICCKML